MRDLILIYARACLKKAFRELRVPVCGRFYPNEGGVAGYGNRIRVKYTAKWGLQIAEMIFQTRSTVKPLTFRMEKSANYPYHLLRMIYSFYIYAGTASFGGSHPNAFNFFKYAWIFRSALN